MKYPSQNEIRIAKNEDGTITITSIDANDCDYNQVIYLNADAAWFIIKSLRECLQVK